MNKIYHSKLNLFKSMKHKLAFKTILKFSLGMGRLFPFFKNDPAKAFITACAASGTVADLSSEANPCYLTPETLKITFYEVGFCTSDPLATGNFVRTSCETSWINTSGFESDIGKKTFEKMAGETFKVPNGLYTHSYAIMSNVWKLKAKYELTHNGGTTYYTNSNNGLVTTTESNYGEWTDDIEFMEGQEGPTLCYDFTVNANNSTIKAVLADSNLVSANNTSTCQNATRLIGTGSISAPLIMDDTVKGYRLNWRITNMGIGISDNGNANNLPFDWAGGPFAAEFTLIK